MFYDKDKSKEDNQKSRDHMNHNRDLALFFTAVVAIGTGILALAITSHKVAKEFY